MLAANITRKKRPRIATTWRPVSSPDMGCLSRFGAKDMDKRTSNAAVPLRAWGRSWREEVIDDRLLLAGARIGRGESDRRRLARRHVGRRRDIDRRLERRIWIDVDREAAVAERLGDDAGHPGALKTGHVECEVAGFAELVREPQRITVADAALDGRREQGRADVEDAHVHARA